MSRNLLQRRLAAVTLAAVTLITAATPSGAAAPPARSSTPAAVTATPVHGCGPIRFPTNNRLSYVAFCTQTMGSLGRSGSYYPYRAPGHKLVWRTDWRPIVRRCYLQQVVPSTDGLKRWFVGYPQLRRPNGSVYTPGTQYWGGRTVAYARVGYFDHRDRKFHPTTRITRAQSDSLRPRGMYPASGRIVIC
jgi:hypothetical protein